MLGRTIRIYLVDGTPTGIMTAEIMNWTGKIIVSPRTHLANLAQRGESKRTGVYILSGEDSNNPLKELVYIGESDNVLNRLMQHNKDFTKDFWNRTIVVISKDENLTKAHVRYLESRLIQLTLQANRSSLSNGTAPETPGLPEADIADMEFFLTQLQTLLPVLGFSFAVPVPTPTVTISTVPTVTSQVSAPTLIEESPNFHFKGLEYEAEAQQLDGQFVVLKGSRARAISKPSLSKPLTERRNQLYKEGKLINHSDNVSWKFVENVPFSSPSLAACVVSGMSVNGRDAWKVKSTGQTYSQWDQERINQAASGSQNED